MRQKNKPYTREICLQIANKYKTRSEFQIKNKAAYNRATTNNWLDFICDHMTESLSDKTKSVYLIRDTKSRTIYIGSSISPTKRRLYQHKTESRDEIKALCNVATIKVIFRTKDYKLAINCEETTRRRYVAAGWNVLNRVKCVATGSKIRKWTLEKLVAEKAGCKTKMEFRRKNTSAYDCAYKNGLLDKLFPIIA